MSLRLPKCLLLAAFLVLAAAGGAEAHAILVSSQPALNAVVPSGRTTLQFRFNSRIDVARSRIVLSAPGTGDMPLVLAANETGNVLSGTADLAPGAYTARWQVLAVDGHITRGTVPFTVGTP